MTDPIEVEIPSGRLLLYEPPKGQSCGTCECGAQCQRILWPGDPVVRNLRGKHMSAVCAVSKKFASWGSLKEAYRELLDRRVRVACPEALPPTAVPKINPPKGQAKVPKEAPLPEEDPHPKGQEASEEEGILFGDALGNAPASVREHLLNRRQP